MAIVKARLIYYRRDAYGASQYTYMSDMLFDTERLQKAVRKTEGVNNVTILGGLDGKGAFVPLSVESYGGYNREDGLFTKTVHLPLPVVKTDPYRAGMLATIEYDLAGARACAALAG